MKIGQNTFKLTIIGFTAITLSACTNTEDTLLTTGSVGSGNIPQAEIKTTAAPQDNLVVAQNRHVQNIQILPIVGGTPQTNQSLSFALQSQAATTNQITMAANPETPENIDLKMQGYLSSYVENGATKINYVWDILDQSGNRIYRLQGQQHVTGVNGDTSSNHLTEVPLSTVPNATIQAIASETISGFQAWKQT